MLFSIISCGTFTHSCFILVGSFLTVFPISSTKTRSNNCKHLSHHLVFLENWRLIFYLLALHDVFVIAAQIFPAGDELQLLTQSMPLYAPCIDLSESLLTLCQQMAYKLNVTSWCMHDKHSASVFTVLCNFIIRSNCFQ